MKLLRNVKKMVCGVVVAAVCSGCAVGAGVSGFSIVSNGLTQQAEKNLIEKAYNEFKVKEMYKQQ